MRYLRILCAILAVASAQLHSDELFSQEEESNLQSRSLIQNKNVNIIVNINAQDLAQELWKVIEARLSNRTSHLASSKNIMKDLEEAILPLVSSTTRRGGSAPSIYKVASQLDKITRRALTRDAPTINILDEEIMTRDIVADMMVSLKMFLSKEIKSESDETDTPNRRSLHRPIATNDDYVTIRIKIRKKDIVNALH